MTTGLSNKSVKDLHTIAFDARPVYDNASRVIDELARRLEEAQQKIVAQQAAMQKATVFLNLHHWKDNGTGRKYWDLDAAGEAHASLVSCYESLAAHDAKVAAEAKAKALEEAIDSIKMSMSVRLYKDPLEIVDDLREQAAEYRAKAKGE